MNQFFHSEVRDLSQWLLSHKGTKLIYLKGDLGVGKTQLSKELLHCFGLDTDTVQSPTFLKLLEYDAPQLGRVLHLDCYRMDEAEDLQDLGIEHYMDQVELIIVEWPDLFEEFIEESGLKKMWLAQCPQKTVEIKLLSDAKREVKVY